MEKRKEENKLGNVSFPQSRVSDNTIPNDKDKDKEDSLPIGRLYSIYIEHRFRESIKKRDFYSPEVILYLLRFMPNSFTTDDLKREELRFMIDILFVPKLKRYWKGIHILEEMKILRTDRTRKTTDIFFTVS